jgi:hypothetical protein
VGGFLFDFDSEWKSSGRRPLSGAIITHSLVAMFWRYSGIDNPPIDKIKIIITDSIIKFPLRPTIPLYNDYSSLLTRLYTGWAPEMLHASKMSTNWME